jgi:hypothetical protein
MQVIFRRTGQRRYGIEARRPQYPDVGMDPAPGYDPLMPHDILHMVVESELGLTRGVFGQLAAGGDAGTFRRDLEPHGPSRATSRRMRRTRSRGAKLLREGHEESAQSERAAFIFWYEWLVRSSDAGRQRLAKAKARQAQQVRATCSPAETVSFTREVIERICRRLDAISRLWSELELGEAVAVSWPDLSVARVPGPSSRGRRV